jgi:hypothetical protein
VKRQPVAGQAMRVIVTESGQAFLRENGRPLRAGH